MTFGCGGRVAVSLAALNYMGWRPDAEANGASIGLAAAGGCAEHVRAADPTDVGAAC